MATKSLAPMRDTIAYISRAGKQRYKPSAGLAMAMHGADEGFCLACGNAVEGIEPDARKDTCPHCGEATVYGVEELMLMGLIG